jgi:hypothetical protein
MPPRGQQNSPIGIPQISFGGGAISPRVFSRIDISKFSTAAKRIVNFFVHAEGGASNRAGTQFIKEVKVSSDGSTRLIPFKFNEEQAYALEFGNLYMRPYRNGGSILESTVNITAATTANPVVVTASSHGYSNGDQVYIVDAGGMTQINGKYFLVNNTTTNTMELRDIDGDDINGSGYTAYTSGGTVARVFTLTTTYAKEDLALIKFRQSNDVMFITHKSYPQRKLTRTGHAAWTIADIDFKSTAGHPTAGSVTTPSGSDRQYSYQVTAVIRETLEESLPCVETGAATISGATRANPCVITATTHGFDNTDEVFIDSVVGMTQLNGNRYRIQNKTTNTFELRDVDSTGFTAYSSAGTAARTEIVSATGAFAAVTAKYVLTWTRPTLLTGQTIEKYNIYREDYGIFGFIGSTEDETFSDEGQDIDLTNTPPRHRNPFNSSSDYPGCVTLHEQRSVYANTSNNPLSVYMGQSSQFDNFNVSSPTKSTDAVTVRLVTGEGNEIRHLRSFQKRLFAFTSGSVMSITPGGDVDAITPTSKQLNNEEVLSCTDVPPLTIKQNILMVAGKESAGFEVHSLGYKIDTDSYSGSEVSVLSRHLLEGFTISEWAYAERPFRLAAAVRNDGKLLVMSYLQEHNIFAWSLWETDGLFESVCSVPEGQDDFLYFVIKRTINSTVRRYVERLHTRSFTVIEDAFFVDSGLSLDAAITISGATAANPCVVTATSHGVSDGDYVRIRDVVGMTDLNDISYIAIEVTANTLELLDPDTERLITAVTKANPGSVTCASHGFSTGDEVGFLSVNGMTNLNGNGYTVTKVDDDTFTIGADTSAFGTYTSGGKVYLNTTSAAFTAYDSAGELHAEVTTVSGLDHLEGETVIALNDGNLETGHTVSSGAITLTNRGSVIHVGLPYTGTLESLPLNIAPATHSRNKIVKQVALRVDESRGIFVGPNENNLEEFPSRSTELWGDPAALQSDLIRIPISDDWARDSGVTVQSENGLPLSTLSWEALTDVGE